VKQRNKDNGASPVLRRLRRRAGGPTARIYRREVSAMKRAADDFEARAGGGRDRKRSQKIRGFEKRKKSNVQSLSFHVTLFRFPDFPAEKGLTAVSFFSGCPPLSDEKNKRMTRACEWSGKKAFLKKTFCRKFLKKTKNAPGVRLRERKKEEHPHTGKSSKEYLQKRPNNPKKPEEPHQKTNPKNNNQNNQRNRKNQRGNPNQRPTAPIFFKRTNNKRESQSIPRRHREQEQGTR